MGLTFNMVTSSNSKTKPPVYSFKKADGVTDADCDFTDEGGGNFMLKLLESGTLNISKLNSAKDGIDVLLVGGGESGGSADYNVATAGGGTGKGGNGGAVVELANHSIAKGDYAITIGESGQNTVAFGQTAATGGGSAGAPRCYAPIGSGSTGGANATNGVNPWDSSDDAILYGAGGGTGNSAYARQITVPMAGTMTVYDICYGGAGGKTGGGDKGGEVNGQANTGAGGCGQGSNNAKGTGGSGIVIIRNHRA